MEVSDSSITSHTQKSTPTFKVNFSQRHTLPMDITSKKIPFPETMHTKSMIESSCISLNLPSFLEDKHFKKIEVGGNEVDDTKKGTAQIALLLKSA